MRAKIVIEVELIDGSDLIDAVQIAEQAAAMLVNHRDVRLVDAEAVGAERK